MKSGTIIKRQGAIFFYILEPVRRGLTGPLHKLASVESM